MKNIALITIISLILSSCGTSPQIKPQTRLLSDIDTTVTPINQDRKDTLNIHNQTRANLFSSSPMTWSKTLENIAQNYANKLANSGKFEHSGNGYGENLHASSYKSTMKAGVVSWNKEKFNYNYNNNSCKSGKICGHYTQIIWKNTTEVGCARATYKRGMFKGGTVVVCNYNPAGNYVGVKPY